MKKNNSHFYSKKISLIEKLLLLYIILLPIMKMPSLPLFNGKIQFCDMVFVLLFLAFIIQIIQKKRAIQFLPLSFIVMLGVLLPSFLHSERWLQSSIEFIGIAYLVCLCFIFYQTIESEAVWWRLIKCWVVVSFFISTTGVIAYVVSTIFNVPNFLTRQEHYGNPNSFLSSRLISVLENPSMLATYLHVSIIFGLILAVKSKNSIKSKLWIYTTVIFCIGAAIITKTRMNAGIALTLFLIVNSFENNNKATTFAKYLSFSFFVAIAIGVFVFMRWEIFPVKFDLDREEKTAIIEVNTVPQVYSILHKKAFEIIKEHPYIGIGMGMYNYASGYIRWEDARDAYRIYYPDITEEDKAIYSTGTDPHSTYLGWGAETGLIGLCGIIFVFFQVAYRIYRCSRITQDKNKKFIYICLLAGIAGFLLNGYYIDIVAKRHFWILIAMSLILMRFDKNYEYKRCR